MTRTAKLLCELIALPSINPAFLPPGDQRAGEQRVADYLASLAAAQGLELEFQPVLPERANLLAVVRPTGKVRRRVLLAPHLDTVGASEAMLAPVTKGGRITGRGACDTKGSVAAMFQAVLDLARGGRRPAETEVVFAGLVDEEHVQAGSRRLAEQHHADLAIVGEATQLKIVTAHKGSVWLQVETRGRSAHGARPELGINAVHRMAKVVDFLETEYAFGLKQMKHPLLGSPTVSVGTICGGCQANIVPDRCAISVDRRTLPAETERSVVADLRRRLKGRGLEVEISSGKHAPCLPLETDPELALVKTFLRSAGQRRPAGVHYFCDASVLARGGIPSVVFGPGDIAQAHTADEWIDERSLEQAQGMLLKFLCELP